MTEESSAPTLEDQMRHSMEGDAIAYAQLLETLSKIIRNYLYGRINRESDIEDIVQETLLSIHKARHTYDWTRPLKPWVLAIANYRMNDFLRKYYRVQKKEVVDYDTIANVFAEEDVTEQRADTEQLQNALNQLPEKQRRIVTLMKVQGYSAKEVAKEMNMSVSAVKVSAHRSYKKLKEYLEAEESVI